MPSSYAPHLDDHELCASSYHGKSTLTGGGVQLNFRLDVETATAEEQKGDQAERTDQQQEPCEKAHSENPEHQ
jgi:hypothetical protein